ncbi:MAG: hypothetical protein FWD31_15675 [Planctomycetaceae bacterium]|nr:hypothetical protein [Planctomycetaceae bacterium]
MSDNIWSANVEDFAVRMTLGDLTGFFSKQLVVAAGTRALIVDDGTWLGVVPPGTYNLQSFTDKLKFWRSAKQVDVVLTRDDDVRLDFRVEQVSTAEELLVAVRVQLILKIEDLALFAKNLLGNRTRMTLKHVAEWLQPIIAQALRESVRGLSIAALTSPDVRPILAAAIQDATRTSMLRYGIACIDIHAAEIVNEQYDEQRQKTGEIFLLDMSTERRKKLDEVLDKETLRKIEQREREIELGVLLKHVEIDGKEADVALTLRLNEVRKNRRDAELADQFDEKRSREESEAFDLEIKKDILRREEELDEISAIIAQAQKIRTLEREIEFAKLTKTEDNRKWEELLNREIKESNSRFQQRMTKLKQDQEFNRNTAEYLNDTELRQLLHRQKTARLELEMEEDSAARQVRVQRVKDEYADEQERRKYAFEKEKTTDRMQILKQMEEMNREREEFEAKLLMDAAAQASAHRITELNTMASMSVEALIATANTANAEILGRVQISKNEAKVTDRERELQDQRVKDAQSANATTLDAIQKITGQAFGAIGQFGGGNAAPGLGAVSPGTAGVIVCPGCRTDNNSVNKFCAKCGKEL